MSHPRSVFNSVTFQAQTHQLTRPPFSIKASDGALGAKEAHHPHAVLHRDTQNPGLPADGREHSSVDMKLQLDLKHSFDAGYKQGLSHAQQEAKKQIEHLTQELAKEKAVNAANKAEQLVQKDAQQLHEQLQAQLKQFVTLSQQLPLEYAKHLQGTEEDMLVLIYEVICRVLGAEATALTGLRAQLQTCLKAWSGRTTLAIHLNPQDMLLLKADEISVNMLKNMGFSMENSSLSWVADPDVRFGGCQLRSSEGALDARLEVQLDALKVSLLKTRSSRLHATASAPLQKSL